jgi:hypothetical protein
MNKIDVLFLVVVLVALASMLACSKVIRAIAWEALRHPFTPSRIEVDGDKVEVHRPAPKKLPHDHSAGAR